MPSINHVPFFMPSLGDDEKNALNAVFESGWLTSGEQCRLFEKEFANFVGANFAVGISSCSAGLILALEALNIPHGSEVLVPSMTFVSTVNAILHAGLIPVFVDVGLHDHNIASDKLLQKINKNTKAIIAVHFAGEPCDLKTLRDICDVNKLFLIEDAAHALPAYYRGTIIGSCEYSDITCFSFYANKTLTTGEGGMLTTNNERIAEHLQLSRSHFMDKHAWNRFSSDSKTWEYDVTGLGHKFNLSDLNAAIGLVQLKKQKSLSLKRANVDRLYRQLLKECEYIELTKFSEFNDSAYHLFQIRVDARDELFNFLKLHGINCSVHYKPVHLMSYYKAQKFDTNHLENTEEIGKRVLSLPLFPSMTKEQVGFVSKKIKSFYEQ